ncbi:hypothetical protein FRC03_005458 [Tulasnella sp. 419]|nr:hypothetical protein FRC03_005458 [Tulasnella sp. 419]
MHADFLADVLIDICEWVVALSSTSLSLHRKLNKKAKRHPLLSAILVNKHWNATITPLLYREVVIHRPEGIHLLLKVLESKEHLRSCTRALHCIYTLSGISDVRRAPYDRSQRHRTFFDAWKLLHMFKNLHHLTIGRNAFGFYPPDEGESVLANLCTLRSLSMECTNAIWKSIILSAPHIKCLDVSEISQACIYGDSNSFFFPPYRLKSLSLSRSANLSILASPDAANAEQWEELEELSLTDLRPRWAFQVGHSSYSPVRRAPISFDSLFDRLTQMSNSLRRLHLVYCEVDDQEEVERYDEVVRRAVTQCNHLEILETDTLIDLSTLREGVSQVSMRMTRVMVGPEMFGQDAFERLDARVRRLLKGAKGVKAVHLYHWMYSSERYNRWGLRSKVMRDTGEKYLDIDLRFYGQTHFPPNLEGIGEYRPHLCLA